MCPIGGQRDQLSSEAVPVLVNDSQNLTVCAGTGDMANTLDSAAKSPRLQPRAFAYDGSDDEEEEFADHHNASNTAERSAIRQLHGYDRSPPNEDGSSGVVTPAEQDGMLPRDRVRKTAYYDHAAEMQLSQADMKLFYQRSQLDARNSGDAGATDGSFTSSPLIHAQSAPYQGLDHMSGSMHSNFSGISMAHR